MSGKRLALAASAFGFTLAMFGIIPWLTGLRPGLEGYLLVFLIYWFGFCIPFGLLFQGLDGARRNLSLRRGSAGWAPWLAAVLILGTGLAASQHWPGSIPVPLLAAVAAASLVNGFSEEFFWRGAWLEAGRGSPAFQFLGVLLFTFWHVPLLLAQGVEPPGGPAALVGGAFLLGSAMAFLAYRTGRIGWAVVAHIGTNAVAFPALLAVNPV